jgi:DNA (cytosine-5)-methyltransferase 1
MRFLSVCSGIEAASVAWNPLGWKAAAFSEIEPFPCAVLAHHYPEVPNLGDMTKFKEWPDDLSIDLLCGGTPCQSFSVAGLRAGLADPRGNLMLTYLAIAAKYRPKWVVWENVPGVLSSWSGDEPPSDLEEGQEWEAVETSDFGSFLAGLGELGYGYAYRVLDAQYFGVPQRRRRTFVVGCLGDWRGPAAVLFERHSLSGHPAPRREARQEPAGTLAGGARKRGGYSADDVPAIAACLTRGTGLRYDTDTDTDTILPVAHSLRGEGFDASEDGTGRGTPLVPVLPFDTTQVTSAANRSSPKVGDPCHPLAAGAHPPAIAFDCKSSGQNGFGVGVEVAGTQRAMAHANSHTNGGGHQAVAFMTRGSNLDVGDISGTLGVNGGSASGSAPMTAYSTKLHNTASNNAGKIFEERTSCLDANSPPPALLTAMQVRRLMPIECERLQGFPDDHTRIPTWNGWRKMDASETPEWCIEQGMEVRQNLKTGKWRVKDVDGPRYKALGNSWAVPCARWLGTRINAVNALHVLERKAA